MNETELRRKAREPAKHSYRVRWTGWSDAEFCDNCGRSRNEARLYKQKIPYFIWEREPLELHKREDVEAYLCEICIAFIEEQGVLP